MRGPVSRRGVRMPDITVEISAARVHRIGSSDFMPGHRSYLPSRRHSVAIFIRRENPALQGGRESPHDTFTCSVAVLGADRRKTPKITPSQQGRTTTPLPDRSNGGVAPPAPRRCANISSQLSEPRLVGSPVVYDGEEVTGSGRAGAVTP